MDVKCADVNQTQQLAWSFTHPASMCRPVQGDSVARGGGVLCKTLSIRYCEKDSIGAEIVAMSAQKDNTRSSERQHTEFHKAAPLN